MSTSLILIKRNIKLFFKDKGMFFTALITPMILLVLYATFLGNVYHDTFTSNLPDTFTLSESIIDGLVGSQLISSILAVSCVTTAFCSNFLMVQDKANDTIKDLRISPVNSATLSLSYYIATLISTLIICFAATGICLAYIATVGWYMSLADIGFLFIDILLKILSFLPGTYGTSLIRNHTMQGVFTEMKSQGVPSSIIEGIKDSLDCNFYFLENQVNIPTMYIILSVTVILLIGIYIFLNKLKKA